MREWANNPTGGGPRYSIEPGARAAAGGAVSAEAVLQGQASFVVHHFKLLDKLAGMYNTRVRACMRNTRVRTCMCNMRGYVEHGHVQHTVGCST